MNILLMFYCRDPDQSKSNFRARLICKRPLSTAEDEGRVPRVVLGPIARLSVTWVA